MVHNMNDRERLRRIAELTTKTDEDVKWDIENLEKDKIWVRGFIEGGAYIRDVYQKALENAEPEGKDE
jgi:hypothetical protein